MGKDMDIRTVVVTAAGIIVAVQVGLFAWLKSDIAALNARMDRVEREVAFVRGQLSLALPALAAGSAAPAPAPAPKTKP